MGCLQQGLTQRHPHRLAATILFVSERDFYPASAYARKGHDKILKVLTKTEE